MRTTRSDLDRVQRISDERATRSRSEASLTILQGGGSVGNPRFLEEVLCLSVCLSSHLSHTMLPSTLSRIKCVRYIFIKKCVSSVYWSKLCLIMFPLVYIYVGRQHIFRNIFWSLSNYYLVGIWTRWYEFKSRKKDFTFLITFGNAINTTILLLPSRK